MSTDAVQSATRLQAVRYMQVCSMMVITYEWAIVLADEVDYMWRGHWSVTKVLYILSRYTPFIDTPLNLVNYLKPHIDTSDCSRNYSVASVSTFIGMCISEYILIVRTHAIYGGSKRMLLILGIGAAFCTIAGSIIMYFFVVSIHFGPLPSPQIPGCLMQSGSTIVFVNFAILLLWEFFIVVLTGYRGYMDLRGSARGPVVETLYRDGIIFFFCLLVLSVANIINFIVAPAEYLDLLDTMTRCLHSIICCRILLNLKTAARDSLLISRPRHIPTLRFARGSMFFKSSFSSDGTATESIPLSDTTRIGSTDPGRSLRQEALSVA